jgi:tetratricopeptide (TPR) repeat protein/transglutaminase-like putative cysteine protease
MKIRSVLTLAVLVFYGAAATSPRTIAAAQAPASPAGARQPSDEAFVIEALRARLRFESNGTGSKQVRLEVRIRNAAGIARWGQMTFPYTPHSDSLAVKTFEVRKPDGAVVTADASAIQDAAVQPLAGLNVFQDIRQKHLTTPALKAGDLIVVALEWTIHTPVARGHFFAVYDFERSATRQEDLEVDVPADRPVTIKLAEGAPAPETGLVEGGRRIYRWRSSASVAASPDDGADDERRTPAVRLSTFRDWPELAAWYAGLVAPAAQPDGPIRQTAQRLIKGLNTDDDRVRALYDYVSSDIRYVSLSFGAGRLAPRSAADVLSTQYGDCKDKHALLAALLKSVGIDAYPVLANSSRRIDPALPSPLEFDHVYTVVPRGGSPANWVWMDTTSGAAPFGFVTSNFRDRDAVIAREGRSLQPLVRTPALAVIPEQTLLTIEGTVNALGVLKARAQYVLRGDTEVISRTVLRGLPREAWEEFARGLAQTLPLPGTITNTRIDNLESTRDPLKISFDVRYGGLFEYLNDGANLVLPQPAFPFLRDKQEAWNDGEPLEMQRGVTITMRSIVELPQGFTPRAPVGISVARGGLAYKSSYSSEAGRVVSERTLTTGGDPIGREQAPEYLALIRAVRADEAQRVALRFDATVVPPIPSDATAAELYAAANAAYKRRSYDAALAMWQRVVDIDPKHPDGWDALGFAYERLGRHKEAAVAFERQTAVSPFHNQAHKDLARALEAIDDDAGAIKALGRHLEITPLDGPAHADLGRLCIAQKRYREAVTHLEKAVAIAPKDAWSQARIGVALGNLKEEAAALRAFEQAVTVSATPPIWTFVGWQLTRLNLAPARAVELSRKTLAHAQETLRGLTMEATRDSHVDLSERVGWSWDTLGWQHLLRDERAAAERYSRAAWWVLGRPETAARIAVLNESAGRRGEPRPARRTNVSFPEIRNGEAIAIVLLDSAATVVGARFVSGDERFRTALRNLHGLRIAIEFPEPLDRLPMRVSIACGEEPNSCTLLPRGPA